jgi:hypothetical protein
MSISVFQKLAEQRRHGKGTSKGAMYRRDKQSRNAGKLHTGRPGDILTIGKTTYSVAADGSFRRS